MMIHSTLNSFIQRIKESVLKYTTKPEKTVKTVANIDQLVLGILIQEKTINILNNNEDTRSTKQEYLINELQELSQTKLSLEEYLKKYKADTANKRNMMIHTIIKKEETKTP